MDLMTNIKAVLARAAAEFKTIHTRTGSLSSLSTTQKANLVGAINELYAMIPALINDTTAANNKTYSSNKIAALIAAAKTQVKGEILGNNVAAAYDTLREIQNHLQTNAGNVTTILTAQAKRVRVDAAQSFTNPEKEQARTNIDVYSKGEIDGKIGNAAALNTNLATYFQNQLNS